MKTSSFLKTLAVVTGAVLLAKTSAFAQAGMPGMDAAMMKLFGNNKFFSADAEVAMVASNGTNLLTMPMTLSKMGSQLRTDVDMSSAKGTLFPAEALTQMKTMGMSKIINIINPDTKTMTMIYPGMTSYLETQIPKDQADALAKEPDIQKTKLGSETLNGHACTKNKVVVTSANGQKQEFTLWAANDLNEFPIRLETTTPQGKLVINYKNLKLEKPDAKLFAAPTGYKKYASQEEFQGAIMKKMMDSQGAK